jgi:hypothetical protein
MKRDPIAKMYDKLSIKQQAALAFNHLISGNQDETERVIESVPMQNYRCRDLDFQDQFEGYRTMALMWSLEYWQLYAQQLEALVRLNIHMRRRDWVKADEAHEEMAHLRASLSAVDNALRTVCESSGLDYLMIRLVAGAKKPSKHKPNCQHQNQITDQLDRLIN